MNNDGKYSLKYLVWTLVNYAKVHLQLKSILVQRDHYFPEFPLEQWLEAADFLLLHHSPENIDLFVLEFWRIMHFLYFTTDSGTCHSSLFSNNIIATIVAKFSADKFSDDESNSKNCCSCCWTACQISFSWYVVLSCIEKRTISVLSNSDWWRKSYKHIQSNLHQAVTCTELQGDHLNSLHRTEVKCSKKRYFMP